MDSESGAKLFKDNQLSETELDTQTPGIAILGEDECDFPKLVAMALEQYLLRSGASAKIIDFRCHQSTTQAISLPDPDSVRIELYPKHLSESQLQRIKRCKCRLIVTSDDPASVVNAVHLIKTIDSQMGSTDLFVLAIGFLDAQQGLQNFQQLTKVTDRFLNASPEYLGAVSVIWQESENVMPDIELMDFPYEFHLQQKIIQKIISLIY